MRYYLFSMRKYENFYNGPPNFSVDKLWVNGFIFSGGQVELFTDFLVHHVIKRVPDEHTDKS